MLQHFIKMKASLWSIYNVKYPFSEGHGNFKLLKFILGKGFCLSFNRSCLLRFEFSLTRSKPEENGVLIFFFVQTQSGKFNQHYLVRKAILFIFRAKPTQYLVDIFFDVILLNLGSIMHCKFFHGKFYRLFLCNFSHYSSTIIFTKIDFKSNYSKIYMNYQ